MHISPPSFLPKLSIEPPSSVPVHEFLFDREGKYGRYDVQKSRPPFTCGLTGKAYSTLEVADRVEKLAQALSAELEWKVDEGKDLDKVIAIYSANTIDTATVSWATHRLNGVSCPVSTFFSKQELTHQLKAVNAKAIFTCAPLLAAAIEAAVTAGIPKSRVYLLELPAVLLNGAILPPGIKTVDQLIEQAASMPSLTPLRWSETQGASQIAYLCHSSGTSGLPKNVKISHRNVIANVLQCTVYEKTYRKADTENCLGVLPFNHAYALVTTTLLNVYRGDSVIVLPAFDLEVLLKATAKFSINRLLLIPPMMVGLVKAAPLLAQYDLSSVNSILVGAASLPQKVVAPFSKLFPGSMIIQGYGLTEAVVVVAAEHPSDIVPGSNGFVLPGFQGRLIDENEVEINDYGTRGELIIQSPSIMLGYHNNPEADATAYTKDGWFRTGDLVELRKSPAGNDHIFIVDRLKELIKVRGMQVSPAELEGILLNNPLVADVAVIPVPDESSGEVPMAFVVKSPVAADQDDGIVTTQLHEYFDGIVSSYKRLAGGIKFMNALPKSIAGKTLRNVLKEQAKATVQAPKTDGFSKEFSFDSDEEDA
jgi:acyl-CoA synthetase (AMP-forming)/AMP-acid ligase II